MYPIDQESTKVGYSAGVYNSARHCRAQVKNKYYSTDEKSWIRKLVQIGSRFVLDRHKKTVKNRKENRRKNDDIIYLLHNLLALRRQNKDIV